MANSEGYTYRGRPQPRRMLAAVAIGWALLLGARFVFPALLPSITAYFETTNTIMGGVITLLWLSYAATQFPAGIFADWTSERTVLLCGAVLTFSAVLITATAPTFVVFVLGGVLFGIGSGLYAPPRITIITETFADRRGSALGITFAVGNLGSTVIPIVAGSIAAAVGWRLGIGFSAPALALLVVALWLWVPNGSPIDASDSQQLSWQWVRTVQNELRKPAVFRATAGLTVTLFVYQGVTTFLPTYLTTIKSLPTTTTTLIFGAFFVGAAGSQWGAGVLSDSFGERVVLVALSMFSVLTLATLPFIDSSIGLGVMSLLLGTRLGVGPVANNYIALHLDPDVRGTAFGLVRTIFLMLSSLGAVVTGYLFDIGIPNEGFVILAVVSISSVFLFATLPQSEGTQRQ